MVHYIGRIGRVRFKTITIHNIPLAVLLIPRTHTSYICRSIRKLSQAHLNIPSWNSYAINRLDNSAPSQTT